MTTPRPRDHEGRQRAPLPPRGLCQQEAADYVGLGGAAFLGAVDRGELPQPMRFGRRRVWDRIALDRALDKLNEGRDDSPEAKVLASIRRRQD